MYMSALEVSPRLVHYWYLYPIYILLQILTHISCLSMPCKLIQSVMSFLILWLLKNLSQETEDVVYIFISVDC